MKKTKENLEHRIQLKKDHIQRYTYAIRNYDEHHMKVYGLPYLQKLNNELQILNNELEDRESHRETMVKTGYSRIGLKNV